MTEKHKHLILVKLKNLHLLVNHGKRSQLKYFLMAANMSVMVNKLIQKKMKKTSINKM
jgi:hypothetical protein